MTSVIDIIGLILAIGSASLSTVSWLKLIFSAYSKKNDDLETVEKLYQSIEENLRRFVRDDDPLLTPSDAYDIILNKLQDLHTRIRNVRYRVERAEKRSGALLRLVVSYCTGNQQNIFSEIKDGLNAVELHMYMWGIRSEIKNSLSIRLSELRTLIMGQAAFLGKMQREDSRRILDCLSQIMYSLGNRIEPAVNAQNRLLRKVSNEDNRIDELEQKSLEKFREFPKLCHKMLQTLSTSGITAEVRKNIAHAIFDLCDPYVLNGEDVRFKRHLNGDRVPIWHGSATSVYKAKFIGRDNLGEMTGFNLPVAVKDLRISEDELDERLPDVLREVYLQMDAAHPCVVKTFGVLWPSHANDDDDSLYSLIHASENSGPYMSPCIVMERMDCNVLEAMARGLLADPAVLLRVLVDVAHALKHLHSRRVVHRDVKPTNVLLRVRAGAIVGHAKLADFGISRRVLRSTLEVTYSPSGSLTFVPPEVLRDLNRTASTRAWDVWSFGALVCSIAGQRGWIHPIDPTNAQVRARTGAITREVARCVAAVSDPILRITAEECLRTNPMRRPRMEVVEELLREEIEI